MKATKRPGKPVKIELNSLDRKILEKAHGILTFVYGNTDGDMSVQAFDGKDAIENVLHYFKEPATELTDGLADEENRGPTLQKAAGA